MDKKSVIYVAGHNGMVGSAIVRKLKELGYYNIVTKSRNEVDLLSQMSVENLFSKNKPEYVFLAAAKVGGINANNTQRAEFIYENLMIQTNIIHASYKNNIKKLLFLGSSCIYPKHAEQPIKESSLLTGPLEQTNEPYAIAKIAGVKMCEAYRRQYNCDFISVMPTNLYGANDNYDLMTSHVFAALIRKFHEAKTNNDKNVTLWGNGEPKREFMFVDDMAEACIFLMENYSENEIINIGTGKDVSIKELATEMKAIIGFQGGIVWDTNMPNGTPRKLLDISKLSTLGYKSKTTLTEGIKLTYQDYLNKHA